MDDRETQRRQTLDEFVAQFDDPDPWAVPAREWEYRLNVSPIRPPPECFHVLLDPDLRDLAREGSSWLAESIRKIDERAGRGMRPSSPGAASPTPAPETAGPETAEPAVGEASAGRFGPPAAGSLARKMADTIRMRRLANRLKQRELARMAGIHEATLWRIESGLRPVTLDELERISQALNASVVALIERASAQADW